MPLKVDDRIISFLSNSCHESKQIRVFALLLVPAMHALNKRMTLEKRLISRSHQYIQTSLRQVFMQMLEDGGRKDHIADKSRLYDENFLQKIELSRNIEIAQCIVE